MTSRAARHDDENTYDPTPADTEKFARMLEQSSLGSTESRSARLIGAETVAEFPATKRFWLDQAPTWPDIANIHFQVADFFEAEQQLDVSELWLRAALSRAINGPMARQLGILLERRHQTASAHLWYLRAIEKGDAVAAGRLASMAELVGAHDVASLIISVERSKLNRREVVRADELVGKLSKAGKRHANKLIDEFSDNDLLFWAGCVALTSGSPSVASTCFTAAMNRGHEAAALALLDLAAQSPPSTVDELADVQSLARRLKEAVQAEPPGEAVPLVPEKRAPRTSDIPDDLLRAAMSGDRDAVTHVLTTIRPLVSVYCRARLGSPDRSFASADDATYEVLLAVLQALPTYRLQGRSFLAFVYRIASQKVVEEARRIAKRTQSTAVVEIPDSVDTGDGPEQQTLKVELWWKMRHSLDRLPKKHHEILLLRAVDCLSVKEIAEILDTTPRAVRVAQHQAVAKLRKLMRESSELDTR